MPIPRLPPTPGASLDLEGKIAPSQAPVLSLGPAARESDDTSEKNYSATPSSDNGSESSYHPASPTTHGAAKRKQSTTSKPALSYGDNFVLPPPPTRTRKIIQMKPGANEEQADSTEQPTASSNARGGKKRGGAAGATAAGRKIARKTAHSLIERRRRSKMNEEFGVLKDMIPACRGQEMHKLAILQASIDYLRYLETCVEDLKAASQNVSPQLQVIDHDTAMDEDEPEDKPSPAHTSFTPIQGSTNPTNSPRTLPSFSSITNTMSGHPSRTSPVFPPLDPHPRPRQASLTSSHAPSPYILPGGSAAASPLFPSQHRGSIVGDAMQRFSLTSPALEPQDAAARLARAGKGSECSDREAMAALLMLNNDRRPTTWGSEPEQRVRGAAMSVKDLLSP